MRATWLSLRNFRSHAGLEVELGGGLNVVWGRNGAGKTNLLEGLYFACTGRSCRTSNEREVVSFGASYMRLELLTEGSSGDRHQISVGYEPGEPKRLRVDDAPVERLADVEARPLVSVFLPDRLELVTGPPALRRGHVDQVVAALWPARRGSRASYSATLAQRNALLSRIRAGRSSRTSLPAWDAELAAHGFALMGHREELVRRLQPAFSHHAESLGLEGEPTLRYRPRSRAASPEELAGELAAHVDTDLERGFTTHGPHRDDLLLRAAGRDLRAYGSRGQQRLALLALLLAEREEIAAERNASPLMLLDDVMSELDGRRRQALTDVLLSGGQSLVTTTELSHVPGSDRPEVVRLAVTETGVLTSPPQAVSIDMAAS